jgi:ABC-type polysaccharide/polyol phosphate transport system ATPase subunit
MASAAAVVDRVSKRYYLGEDRPGGSLRETLSRSVRVRGRGARRQRDQIWSLRDVSLEVAEGAAIGVIGRNGAGKTTLLKVLSRITEPTSGVSRTRGRVGALLEVGTGFHPELTGRENVYLNGAILGMTRRDIRRRYDEIIEFAGVERFVDTPVKRYSSGMYLRLAFSVAAHFEPDILIVDEVLAVGDAEFQRKCMSAMASAEDAGRTVVFVSHDLEAIARLCEEVVWLERGIVHRLGAADQVVADYLASGVEFAAGRSFEDRPDAPVSLRSVTTSDARGLATTVLPQDRGFCVSVRYLVRDPVPRLDLAVYVLTARGVRILDEMWSDTVAIRPNTPGEYEVTAMIPPVLNVGDYTIGVWIGTTYETIVDESATAGIRLEGSVKERPDRLVELRIPWSHRRLDGVDIARVHRG